MALAPNAVRLIEELYACLRHQCCRWENGDFDTSLFLGSSSTNECPLDQQHA